MSVIGPFPTYRPDDLGIPTGIVAWWKLNDASGTSAIDSSGNGHTGTLNGSGGFPSWTTGPNGTGALAFSGANSSYVDCGVISQIASSQFATTTGWAFRASTGIKVGFGTYLFPHRFSLVWYSDDNIYFGVDDGVGAAYNFQNQGVSGWHHIAMVFDGTQSVASDRIKGYFDGVLITTPAGLSGVPPTSLANLANQPAFRMGMDDSGSGGRFWDGSLDDVRLYNTALSASDVLALYNGGAA